MFYFRSKIACEGALGVSIAMGRIGLRGRGGGVMRTKNERNKKKGGGDRNKKEFLFDLTKRG